MVDEPAQAALPEAASASPASTAVCRNCGTVLRGRWCHHCGQSSTDLHRSSAMLIWEAMEHLFSADGRVWRTLPRLLLRPGTLTRNYLAGKRAPQVPPLRLFFIVVLLVFLAGNLVRSSHRLDLVHFDGTEQETVINRMRVQLYAPWDETLTRWARSRIGMASQHPQALVDAMAEWAHDFAIMTLPVSALILSLLFVFRRQYVLFDHLVFAMHSLSFQGLLATVAVSLRAITSGQALLLLWLAPVHLFAHMRGFYGTGIIGTLLRMGVLFVVGIIAFSVMMAGLVLAGLQTLKV